MYFMYFYVLLIYLKTNKYVKNTKTIYVFTEDNVKLDKNKTTVTTCML